MKPFLKWAGGKHRLAKRIKQRLAPGNRLLEPFAGGCALSLEVEYDSYWLNDINPDLIRLYQMLQLEGEKLISYCQSFFTPENNTPERYYELRERFNQEADSFEKAALFLYLNRHGYNGLCRYNSSGEFNVPFGKYRKPYFPLEELRFFVERFHRSGFSCMDFEAMMLQAKPGDVVYCDPPYMPLNNTAKFTQFSMGGFSKADQLRLADTAKRLAERGIQTIISNHYSEIIVQAYEGARIETFPVQRFISCNGEKRHTVDEVLAVFG